MRMTSKFMRLRFGMPRGASARWRKTFRIPWGAAEGAELLEFALLLPIILVMVVGLLDFARAYNIKQKLANAARDGARLGAAEPTADIEGPPTPTPATVQAIADDVTTYLQDAGVDTSFISASASPCVTSGNPNGFCWQYLSTGNYGLTIEREVQVLDANNIPLRSTRVTLVYPYDWTFGFNHVIALLYYNFFHAGTLPSTISITTDAMMQNQ